MPVFNHQLDGWPKLVWKTDELAGRLAALRHRQGPLLGRMQALGFNLRAEAVLRTLTEDVLKSRSSLG